MIQAAPTLPLLRLPYGRMVSRKGSCGNNILAREARISIKNGFHRPSLTKQAKDNFDRYSRSSNDRLPHHHLWILCDSLVCHRYYPWPHSAAIAAPTRACSISRSARRYSTGITFTNLGR